MIKLFRYIRKKEAVYIVISLIFILGQVYLDLRLPDFMTVITELVQIKGSSFNAVLSAGAMMLLCALGSMVCSIIVGYLVAKIAAGLAMHIRKAVYDRVMDFTMEEIERFSTASLITRSTNDITQITMVVAIGLQAMVKAPIMAVWAIIKIAGKNFNWTAVTIAAVILVLILLLGIFIAVIPRFTKIQTLTDNLNRVTRENISGIRVVRAYNAEEYQKNKFDKANEELTINNLFAQRALALMQPGMTFIMSALTLAIYWVGAYMIEVADISGRLDIFSQMVVFSSYALQVIMAFMMMTMTLIIMPRASVSAKRILEVLNTIPGMTDGTLDVTDLSTKGRVEFKDVSFRYPDADGAILHNISFEANPGETVAIIGATGSGKSTLINLIPRFYDVSAGEVIVDGVNVKEYKQHVLRNKIGYVSQKATLFSGTVKSNVTFGSKDPNSNDLLAEALATAKADEFVYQMEGAVEAPIAQNGSNVSGGQRQRLSIARAIYKKPEIYIFDDSFSALDYKTDRALRQALKDNTKGATILIVAQRIVTIMDADRIIVLDEGSIAGMGTHEQLLTSCSVYREIAESQLTNDELYGKDSQGKE